MSKRRLVEVRSVAIRKNWDVVCISSVGASYAYLLIATRPTRSGAGADLFRGLWQVMPDTARRYGLVVSYPLK